LYRLRFGMDPNAVLDNVAYAKVGLLYKLTHSLKAPGFNP
jgi:hypothetical protein